MASIIRTIDTNHRESVMLDVLVVTTVRKGQTKHRLQYEELPGFKDHPWLTAKIIDDIVDNADGDIIMTINKSGEMGFAHWLCQQLNKVAPPGWTLRVHHECKK